MLTETELESAYNTYMEESAAFADQVIASDFVMKPPTFEEMRAIIGRQEANKDFRDHASTLVRHQFSNYDILLRALPTPAAENRFKYLVYKAVKSWVNANYREGTVQ
jgi:hypothetical protein